MLLLIPAITNGNLVLNIKTGDAGETVFTVLEVAGVNLSVLSSVVSPVPNVTGMAADDSVLYAFNRYEYWRFNARTLALVDSFEFESKAGDLALVGASIWSVEGPFLEFRGADVATVQRRIELEAGRLESMAWDGDTFWLYDSDDKLIIHADSTGAILGHYRAVAAYTKAPLETVDLEYRPEVGLVAVDKISGQLYYTVAGQSTLP